MILLLGINIDINIYLYIYSLSQILEHFLSSSRVAEKNLLRKTQDRFAYFLLEAFFQ